MGSQAKPTSESFGKGATSGLDAAKPRRRFNALKHGVHAKALVVPGEDASAFLALRDSVLTQYKPNGPVENALVDQIAANVWRLGRLEKAQLAALKRTAIEASLQETETSELTIYSFGADVDAQLRQQLLLDETSDGRDKSVVLKASSERRTPGQEPQQNGEPPISFTFMKAYGAGRGAEHVSEIERKIVSTTRDLVRLDKEICEMQERRQTVSANAGAIT